MTTMPPPQQLPEGALIERAQGRHTPRLSNRKAAEMAGMSEGRWRHIVKGYQTVQAGMHASVTAPADTLARMAHAVGVTPDELRDVGRVDAAEAYERMLGISPDSPPAEMVALEDDPEWQRFEGVVRGTPPELRAVALQIATAAVEAARDGLARTSQEVNPESK